MDSTRCNMWGLLHRSRGTQRQTHFMDPQNVEGLVWVEKPVMIYSIMVCWIIDRTPCWCTYSHHIHPLLFLWFQSCSEVLMDCPRLREFMNFLWNIYTELNKAGDVLLMSPLIFCFCLFLVPFTLNKASCHKRQQSHFSNTHVLLWDSTAGSQRLRADGHKGFFFTDCNLLLSSLDNITMLSKHWCVRNGAMGRLWHDYKDRRGWNIGLSLSNVCIVCDVCEEEQRSLTFVRFEVDSAEFGSNSIVRFTKVDSRKALRVVADFQLPSDTVWENTHTHTHRLTHVLHMCTFAIHTVQGAKMRTHQIRLR